MSTSVNKKEIENFAKDSAHWWDENGPHGILHRLNPVRMEYLISQIGDVKEKSILDVGCGGGLVCENFARLGANITGIDADAQAIEVAIDHAEKNKLDITYKNQAIEEESGKYHIVLALEIIEHVDNPAQFITECATRVKKGGQLIVSTLNRTPKSFALGIVGAEYILNVVPRGTHSWKKFIKPHELANWMNNAGLNPAGTMGLTYNPVTKTFALDKHNLDVNYFMSGTN